MKKTNFAVAGLSLCLLFSSCGTIDECDNQLMDLLAKRMRVCREIGTYKKEHNM